MRTIHTPNPVAFECEQSLMDSLQQILTLRICSPIHHPSLLASVMFVSPCSPVSLSLVSPLPELILLLALPKCEHTPQLSPQLPAHNLLGFYLRADVVPATLSIPSYGAPIITQTSLASSSLWYVCPVSSLKVTLGNSSCKYLKSTLIFPLLIFPLSSLTVLMQQV